MRTTCFVVALTLAACGSEPPEVDKTAGGPDRPTTIGSCAKHEFDPRVVRIVGAMQSDPHQADPLKKYDTRINEKTFVTNGYEYTVRGGTDSDTSYMWLEIWRGPEGRRGDGPAMHYADDNGDGQVDFAFGTDEKSDNGEFRTCAIGSPNPALEQFWQEQYDEALGAAEKFFGLT